MRLVTDDLHNVSSAMDTHKVFFAKAIRVVPKHCA
jgi:hypothetical protein